jgi:hypothetical protein
MAEKGTGLVSAIGGLDRATAQFFDVSFLTEIFAAGTVLTGISVVISVCAIVYFVLALGIVDLDDL